jgi:hypothetical protein
MNSKDLQKTTEDIWALPISRAAQRAALASLRTKGLKTDADVAALVSWLRRPRIGTKVNCAHDDHQAPFTFLADVLVGRTSDFITWANRAGSKSYLAALITWTRSMFLTGLETTVLGGSLEQSEKVYKGLDEFWQATGLQDELTEGVVTRRMTKWKNGSQVSVLTASTRSTRGPHPQSLLMDEIDEMSQEVYEAAMSQPQAKRGIGSMLGRFSTNHRWGGMMDRALEQARAYHTPVYKWCVWEVLKSCRDYSCSTCKVSRFCPGTHMKDADGYYELEDFVKKAEGLSEHVLQVEWLCEKLGRDDLVYGSQFDMDLHSPLGLPEFNEGLPVLVSIDWGGAAPFSVGAWQKFEFGWVRIDEVYQANTTNRLVMAECKLRPWWKNVVGGVADPSRVDLKKEWEDEGIRLTPANNVVDAGIDATRNALRPLVGTPLFYVSRRCQNWLGEVQSYEERNGRPVKKYDHAMDETRYFVVWQMALRTVRAGGVYFSGMKGRPRLGEARVAGRLTDGRGSLDEFGLPRTSKRVVRTEAPFAEKGVEEKVEEPGPREAEGERSMEIEELKRKFEPRRGRVIR